MRVSLLYPPPAPPTFPYGSLPILTGWLRKHGHDVIQRDLNVEIWDWLLSSRGLSTTIEMATNKLSPDVESLRMNPLLPYPSRNLPHEEEELERSLQQGQQLVACVSDAKALVRGGDGFYEQEEYWSSISIIYRAELLYRAAYFMTTDRGLSTFDQWRDPMAMFADDDHENPLISLFSSLFLQPILDDDPDLVGFSVPFGDQLMPALTLSALLKKEKPNIKVVFGGPTISMFSSGFAQSVGLAQIVDYFVNGEGEMPLLGLVEALAHGDAPSEVPGLIYRQGTSIHANPPAPSIDMNRLPPPVLEGLSLKKYLAPETVFPIAASRRCYWDACSFCAMSPARCGEKSSMHRDADHLVRDVEEMQRLYGARCFFFSDLAVAPSVLSRFSKKVLERELDIVWYCFARFEKTYDADFCRRLADAGCRRLLFGLESGNPRVNQLLNKGVDYEHAKQTIAHCRDSGISIDVACIIGFPTETREEAHDTAAFFLDNADRFGSFTTFNLNHFTLTRGSRVHQKPEEYGVEIESDGLFSSCLKYRVERGISQEEARALCQTLHQTVREGLGDKVFFSGIDYDTHNMFYADHYRAVT